MTPPLRILSLSFVLLMTGAAFARNVQFFFVFFDQLRSKPSFQARVLSVAYWDPKEPGLANGGFTKEGRIADKPPLWVMVTQTNGTRLQLTWEEATTQHLAFARNLQVSNTYRFPEVWDEFVAPKNKK